MTHITRFESNPISTVTAPYGDSGFEHAPMADVATSISVIENTCIVMNVFAKAGDSAPGHRHHFRHQSLLTNGRVRVCVDGVTTEYSAPKIIIIEKNKTHQFTALEDGTALWCVHAARDIEGEVLDADAPADTPMHPISKGL